MTLPRVSGPLALWHQSIEYIGAGLGTVLANMQALFVGVAAWVLYRERPTRLALVMVPAVLVGVMFISGLGQAGAYGSRPALAVALPRLPALETSVVLLVQPFGTVLWSRWIFGERMSPFQWTGALMVLTGVAVLSARGSVQVRR